MSDQVLVSEQLVRAPREEVFDFFSRPENLARVTPPRLGFEILTPSPVPMRVGSLIDYRIRILGLPLYWRTLITAYEPGRLFVDEQARGPYAAWTHRHEFEDAPEGTLVRDTVRYRLPLGLPGRLAAGELVRADLDDIFRYRRKIIASVFPDAAPIPGGSPMNIVLAGGTGFIGSALVDALIARGDKVVLLTRSAAKAAGRTKAALREWDAKNPGPWRQDLDGADAVINLCGENVADGRWTLERKLALIKSRVDSTRALVEGIGAAARKPKVLINASAVGYYGGKASGECAEDAAQGSDFLAALCGQWEREALAAEKHGTRVCRARIGVVLEEGGGALSKMLLPFKLGVGGPLGSGRQAFPWIHRADAVGAILFLLGDAKASGAYNFAAPGIVTNAEFSSALGRALHRPAFLPAPAFALKIALGEMADMLLGGQRATPKRLLAAGYAFKHPTVDEALKAILA